MWTRTVLCLTLLPGLAAAQEPLSVIEWLSQPGTGTQGAGLALMEPPVTETALRPEITVEPLAATRPPLGLVSSETTGLPVDLWQGSDADALAARLGDVPVQGRPAMQTLLYTLLLAETTPPAGTGAAETLLLARVDRLMALGAVNPAQALLEQAGPEVSAARFARWFDATLLTGDEDRSCATLDRAPHLSPGLDARIFCAVRAGRWSDAALMLETSMALEALPADTLAVLDRFVNPDLADGAAPLPIPQAPDPLRLRLQESIGEPIPTAALPRAFANADLRDLAGWKAQLEAAERLARSGALGPNQLLGLYDARLPAASGGVWDRVEAVQRFETALRTRSPDAVARALPGAWSAMRAAGLGLPFAALFAEPLTGIDWRDPAAAALAARVALLSADYERAAQDLPAGMPQAAFLAGLARGAPPAGATDLQAAIAAGFATPPALPPETARQVAEGRLGEVVLDAMRRFDIGARGNLDALSGALVTLRAVGLEDTARRAALQLVLLDRD